MFRRVSEEANQERLVQTVRALVATELQRLGKRVTPRVDGLSLVVGKGADEARADLKGTLDQWESLPEDLRERRVRQIAQLLGEAAGRAPVQMKPRPRRRSSHGLGLSSAIMPIVIALLTLGALLVAYRYLAPNGAATFGRLRGWASAVPGASAIVPKLSNPEPERATLASSACGAAQTRVARGAVVGPADVEGWQVELVLLRRGPPADLSASPSLAQFVRRTGSSAGTVIWKGAESLAEIERFDARVEVTSLPALGQKQLSGVSLVFSGPYVSSYFSEELRADYFKLADALSSALGASEGALFAHCANVETHQIGSWFLGKDPSAAVASLVFFMASYSDLPVLKPEVLGSPTDPRRHGHAFDAISEATTGLDRNSVASLLGSELGMISGRPGKPSRITFPFRDANRANRASLQAASALRLATAR